MQLGATLSHHELKFLNIDIKKAVNAYLSLNFDWVRLAIYWNEVEPKKGELSFKELDRIISLFEKKGVNIVLAIGMKAPRYPEYYLPPWIKDGIKPGKLSKIGPDHLHLITPTLEFIEKSIGHFKGCKAVKVWQIENEPLDPAGPDWLRLDYKFLEQEVALARKLDPERKIMINLWGNELSKRKVYLKAASLANIVALDIYPRHPIPFLKFFTRYFGPLDSREKMLEIVDHLRKQHKQFWIAELQAEPWEHSHWSTIDKYPSYPPKQLSKNFNYARILNPEVTLFWGFEFWLYQKLKGNDIYWQEADALIRSHKKL